MRIPPLLRHDIRDLVVRERRRSSVLVARRTFAADVGGSSRQLLTSRLRADWLRDSRLLPDLVQRGRRCVGPGSAPDGLSVSVCEPNSIRHGVHHKQKTLVNEAVALGAQNQKIRCLGPAAV